MCFSMSKLEKGQQYSVSERLEERGPNPEQEYLACELTGHMRQLVTHRSPTVVRTFRLRDMASLPISETAEILGIPAGTAKAQLARAKEAQAVNAESPSALIV
jgi:DNA-directed RNA polymerase specialized sigma24 family protein